MEIFSKKNSSGGAHSFLTEKTKTYLAILLLVAGLLFGQAHMVLAQTPVFINEIHYDNDGTDQAEAVEIAGPAGTDVTGWRIIRYNGSGGAMYTSPAADPEGSDVLSGTIPDNGGGFGVIVVYFLVNGLQNGAPDGIALVDASNNVIQFLSFEGSFEATDGPASGMTSSDIGVSEASNAAVGTSLQLGGSGSYYEDFVWNGSAAETFGAFNNGQSFVGGVDIAPSVSGTTPSNSAIGIAVDSDITINFSKDVSVAAGWYDISGSESGTHTASVSSGPVSFILNPDVDFSNGETVTVTVFAVSVTDADQDDPPDNMAADYTFSFTTALPTGVWVINEILADPDASAGDANSDGAVNTTEDEFVEIVNNSGASQDISGWTLADGVSARHTFPSGTVIPHQGAVVIFAGGTPTGSFGGAIVQIASSGQLGLNNTGDTVTLNNGTANVTVYTYGSEGNDNQSLTRDPDITGPEPLLKHSTATGSGGALFSPGTRIDGSRFPGHAIIIPALEIYQIQGAGMSSPYADQTVTTENNVVTAVGPDGFFVQTPAARSDGDIVTSDGLFVYTGSSPAVAVGDWVNITGEIQEYYEMTEFSSDPEITFVSSGNPLPAAVQFDENVPSPNQPWPENEMERFEGMLVEVQDATATAASDEYNISPIVAKDARVFREEGIEYPGESGLPVWDGNPEIFEIDPDRLGLADEEMFAGTTLTATGCLGFSFGDYQIWPTSLTITDTPSMPSAVRNRENGEVTVGTLNMLRLFQNEPNSEGYQDRLNKFSMYIRNQMLAPEILAVQEAGAIDALHDLADKIRNDDASVDYAAYLIEGNDVSGIDVGFLVRTGVLVNAVTQLGAGELFSYDGSLLHDRPPLLLEAEFANGNAIEVMNLHLRSMNDIEDDRVQQKRHEQATSVSRMIQDIQNSNSDVNLVVCGDFNAFEFTDGYVHVLGQIMGQPASASEAKIPGTDEVNPDLQNRVFSVSQSRRYSYNFSNSAQVLDHFLTSHALDDVFTGLQFARANSDVPLHYENDGSTSLRCSDHDGAVLYLAFEERYQVAGTVIYDSKEQPVPDVTVTITHPEGAGTDVTDDAGAYSFENILAGDVTLSPSREGGGRGAVTSSDALYMYQYIKYGTTLTEDEMFAADVDEDGQVTRADVKAILRFIAYFPISIASTGQWRFIPESASVTLDGHKTVDFKAYVLGDATLNWTPELAEIEAVKKGSPVGRASNVTLEMPAVSGYRASQVRIPLFAKTAGEKVNTLSLSFNYDASILSFQSIQLTDLTSEFLVETNATETGVVHVAMLGAEGVQTDGEVLWLVFDVQEPEKADALASVEISSGSINDVSLANFAKTNVSFENPELANLPGQFKLSQNYPNPFNPETRISFQLPEARHVKLQIFNVLGKEIRTLVDEKREAGYHQLIWDGANGIGEQAPSGVYFMMIKAGEWQSSCKMMKIE
ncbi:MAG: lamin tail domain-containing protein [Candidatus Zhuqueibacterota bacterium]